jgi:hypothetical protein
MRKKRAFPLFFFGELLYNGDIRVKSGEDPVLAQWVFNIFDPPKHEYVAICKAN